MLTIKKIMEMMKKILMMAILCFVFTTSGFAQFKRTAFNHVGLNAGVGTEGISIGVAAPISNFVELEAGVDILPKFLSISEQMNITADASIIVQGQTVRIPNSKVDVDADFSRTAFHAKANIYPFGGNSKFFVAAGFAMGGAKLAKLSGHSDDLAQFIRKYPEYSDEILKNVGAELSDYNIKFDKNGDINADLRCNSFRPYLGLGFGRVVPKNRLGFRWEIGCQYMGKLKIYQNGEEVDVRKALNDSMGEDGGDIADIVDKLKFYPVLKLQIVGRIL